MYKIGELVKLSGGKMDDDMKEQFEDITRTILDNQASQATTHVAVANFNHQKP